MNSAKIYAIAERSGPIRYVGHTTQSIEQRIKLHISANSAIGGWMQGNDYVAVLLEECPRDQGRARERFWIVQCREAGHPLMNKNGFSPNYIVPSPPKPRKPMLPEFQALVDRCWPLRITESELARMIEVSATAWWRAKNGVTSQAGTTRILAKAEAVLDQLEATKGEAA